VTVTLVAGYDIARMRKWKQGREQYGPTFVGNPVVEFYDEMVDSGNYLEEMARQGSLLPEDLTVLDDMVRAIVMRLGEALENKRLYDARFEAASASD
jgi:hypothetical protein